MKTVVVAAATLLIFRAVMNDVPRDSQRPVCNCDSGLVSAAAR